MSNGRLIEVFFCVMQSFRLHVILHQNFIFVYVEEFSFHMFFRNINPCKKLIYKYDSFIWNLYEYVVSYHQARIYNKYNNINNTIECVRGDAFVLFSATNTVRRTADSANKYDHDVTNGRVLRHNCALSTLFLPR